MKTFKEYGGDTVDPHYHAYGGSLLGPSLGQYRPVADLNANRHNNSKKQLLGPVKPRTGEKEVTKSDLDQLERYADRLFGACLLYTSPSPRDLVISRMPSSA